MSMSHLHSVQQGMGITRVCCNCVACYPDLKEFNDAVQVYLRNIQLPSIMLSITVAEFPVNKKAAFHADVLTEACHAFTIQWSPWAGTRDKPQRLIRRRAASKEMYSSTYSCCGTRDEICLSPLLRNGAIIISHITHAQAVYT